MALKQIQTTKQTMRIELSKIMLMNLIQTPNEKLREVVEKEVDENPALEIDDSSDNAMDEECSNPNISIDELREQDTKENYGDNADDWEPGSFDIIRRDPNEQRYERPIVATFSYRDQLIGQLGELDISTQERETAEYIIGNLEDSGYLLRDNNAISMDLLLQYGRHVSTEEIEHIIVDIIQTLEPPGTGARDLQECLLIQIKLLLQNQSSPTLHNALNVVQNHFQDLKKKNHARIIKSEKMTEEEWERVLGVVKKLVPYPGEGGGIADYAIPDFIITIEDGNLQLDMAHEYKPKLRIRKEYEDLYAHYRKKKNQEVLKFINENIEKARSFITALPDRDKTMYLVMHEIMRFQHDYFLTGNRKKLVPMVLKDIAERVHLDISTISRVTSKRYAQTPYGIIALKDLFTEATNENDGISSGVLKQEITEIIEKEDKKRPLTDEKIAEILTKQGYNISRRTVAKYREQLGISATSVRKEKS